MASVSKKIGASLMCLPDEIVFEIFSNMDIKTLGICERVSRQFYQIACQFTFFFKAPSSWNTNEIKSLRHVYSLAEFKYLDSNYYFRKWFFDRKVEGLIESMSKFTRNRCLYIKLPLSSVKDLPCLKWKLSIESNRILSFVLLSPYSIRDTRKSAYDNGNDDREEEEEPYYWSCIPHCTAMKCLEDVSLRYMMLFHVTRKCPFLEKISITDGCKRGRISFINAKLSEGIKSSTALPKIDDFLQKVSGYHIPLLDLPVSGLLMKGVKLMFYEEEDLPYEYINIDFEGKERAAYNEAVMEIFKKHKDRISHHGNLVFF